MPYCFNCGNRVKRNNRFCHSCGTLQKNLTSSLIIFRFVSFATAIIALAMLLFAGIIMVLELSPGTTKEISKQRASEMQNDSPDKTISLLFQAIENKNIDVIKKYLHDEDLYFIEEQGYSMDDLEAEIITNADFFQEEYGPNWSNIWNYETVDATKNYAMVRITTSNHEEYIIELEKINGEWMVFLDLFSFFTYQSLQKDF